MCRAISELYSEPLDPVESLHLFCRLLSFHFSGGQLPLWAGSCGTYPAHRLQVLFPSAGDPCSLLGHDSKLKESVVVPRRCEQWFWVTPPLWLNPHHKAEDWSRSLLGLELVVTWCCFFPPFLPCGLFVWYCTRQRYCRLLYCMFSIHGQQSEVYLSALNCYTTEKYVEVSRDVSPNPTTRVPK